MKVDCFLALVFENKGLNLIPKAIQEMNAKRIIIDERTVLIITKNLNEMKEFLMHKKYIPYVKLFVIPKESVFGIDGRNPIVTFYTFVGKDDMPLKIEYSTTNLVENYIMIEDCTDFKLLTIKAEKNADTGKVKIIRAELLNCSFTVEGEDEEDCLIMDKHLCVEFLCSHEPFILHDISPYMMELARQAFKKK